MILTSLFRIFEICLDIAEVAKVLRETAADDGLAPIPIFGNGDAYDYRTYYENMEASGVDGIMIARGALVKVCNDFLL